MTIERNQQQNRLNLQPLGEIRKQIAESTTQKSAADLENTVRSMLDAELSELRRRVEDLENRSTNAMPIPQLTPSDGIAQVKKTLNFLLTYLNIGIKHG